MTLDINIPAFIAEHITNRKSSLFAEDLTINHEKLTQEIEGKNVLVIGGAGTIGSSYIRALLPYKPAKLVVVDTNENGLTELVRDCRSRTNIALPIDFKSYPINFSDPVFNKIFTTEGPFDIVANFAAHKHVRSEKDVFSIEAMIDNNVIKAKNFLDILLHYPPAHFFCVSTDKAANPVNIMGASKKLMENVIMAYSTKLNITTARFANVAFSNGSLPDGFIQRIIKKQPLSSPSDVKRFFVSPDESGQICLLACILGKTGDIFFPKLDMEKDLVSFKHIAKKFIEHVGYQELICSSETEAKQKAEELLYLPDNTLYPIYYFASETSGEKLYEEFYTEDETLDLASYTSLGVIKNTEKMDIGALNHTIEEIKNLFKTNTEKKDVVNLLVNLLPGFKHIETGLNLDQKM